MATPINACRQSVVQAEKIQPGSLSFANLSENARLALDQTEGQFNENYSLLARFARNGIKDNTLKFNSTQQHAEEKYTREVNIPNKGWGMLTILAKLNKHSKYDILRIDLNLHGDE